MKIISSTDFSRPGNDVYIHEELSLVEQFEIYAVIRIMRVTGWADNEEVSVLYTSNSRSTATERYKSYGGKI
jgi:hypothetical protein